MDKRLKEIAKTYGYDSQSQMLIEEMSELTKAVCKLNRMEKRLEREAVPAIECDKVTEDVLDEIADVQIMIYQMCYIMRFSDEELNERMDRKIERQLKRIHDYRMEMTSI